MNLIFKIIRKLVKELEWCWCYMCEGKRPAFGYICEHCSKIKLLILNIMKKLGMPNPVIQLRDERGEVYCDRCKGWDRFCWRCQGHGKVDWIENVIGRYRKKY